MSRLLETAPKEISFVGSLRPAQMISFYAAWGAGWVEPPGVRLYY